MANTNLRSKSYYTTLNEKNIQFLQGSQADLNKFLPGGTSAGEAIEGAFYLTTDTHRLYVGRKVQTTTGSYQANKVYPEEVSTGISVVKDTGSLNDVAAEAHDGDFYYIQKDNILAVYENGGWVQINAPTGINKINTGVKRPSGSTTDAMITTEISTDAGTKTGKLKFVAGNNVQLTPGTTDQSDSNYDIGEMTISATDTTYAIGSTKSSSNGSVQIGLKKNGGTSLEAGAVTIKGSSTTGETVNVTSDSSGNIIVSGPKFSSTGISYSAKTGANSSYGIDTTLTYTDGAGSTKTTTGTIDPQISYGQSGSKSTAHFTQSASGQPIIADLDVYTKSQADTAISDAIADELATANAMTYKGIVTSVADLKAKIIANGGAHNGDVYKVGSVETAFSVPATNGVQVQTGDLIIISGTEDTSGTYAGQITISGAPVSNSTTTDSILNNLCELIPSGDEPQVTASATATSASGGNTAQTGVRTTLYDGKKGTEDTTNILTTRYLNGNKIKVSSVTKTGNSGDPEWVKSTGQDIALTFSHETTTRTDSTSETVAAAGTANAVIRKSTSADTIGNDGYELFVFSDPSKALTTDSYGHVTGLKGKTITLKHNKLNSSATIAYSTPSTNVGRVGFTLKDSLNNTTEGLIDFSSSTLQVAGDSTNNKVNIDLKWGTFSTT